MLSEMLGGGQAYSQMEWIPFWYFPVMVLSPMWMFPNLRMRPVREGCSVTWRFSLWRRSSVLGVDEGAFAVGRLHGWLLKLLCSWTTEAEGTLSLSKSLEIKVIWKAGNFTMALDWFPWSLRFFWLGCVWSEDQWWWGTTVSVFLATRVLVTFLFLGWNAIKEGLLGACSSRLESMMKAWGRSWSGSWEHTSWSVSR